MSGSRWYGEFLPSGGPLGPGDRDPMRESPRAGYSLPSEGIIGPMIEIGPPLNRGSEGGPMAGVRERGGPWAGADGWESSGKGEAFGERRGRDAAKADTSP